MQDIDRLIAGFHRFCEGSGGRGASETRSADAFAPAVMVIACADFAADPQHITDAPPGSLLVIRNVANIVPPYAPDSSTQDCGAALEFGVTRLGVEHILVLGHGGCTAIKALLDAGENAADAPIGGEFLPRWLALAVPGLAKAMRPGVAPEARARTIETEGVRLSLENLMSYPWIFERVTAGRLHLHGWYVDLAQGTLARLDPETDLFEEV